MHLFYEEKLYAFRFQALYSVKTGFEVKLTLVIYPFLTVWLLFSDPLWSSVRICMLESVYIAFHLSTWVPTTMLHFSFNIERHSSFKYFSVKHVCFACFVPSNKSVIGGEWEIQDFLCHLFSISGFLTSRDCTLLFSPPDKLKSSTATKIDSQSPCAQNSSEIREITKCETDLERSFHCPVRFYVRIRFIPLMGIPLLQYL